MYINFQPFTKNANPLSSGPLTGGGNKPTEVSNKPWHATPAGIVFPHLGQEGFQKFEAELNEATQRFNEIDSALAQAERSGANPEQLEELRRKWIEAWNARQSIFARHNVSAADYNHYLGLTNPNLDVQRNAIKRLKAMAVAEAQELAEKYQKYPDPILQSDVVERFKKVQQQLLQLFELERQLNPQQ
jgi:protein-tyrosine-phosphatase